MSTPLDLLIEFMTYTGTTSNNPADVTKIRGRIQESNVTAVTRYQNQIADSVVDQTINLPDPNSELIEFINSNFRDTDK